MAMPIPAALVVVPLGLLFLLSGLIVNLIQATCFVTIRPLSKSMYRRINRVVVELLWLQLVWLVDWWAGVEIRFYADSEDHELLRNSLGKEHAFVISNHRSDIDWLVGWIFAQRAGCLGSTLAVMKKSLKFLPLQLTWNHHAMCMRSITDSGHLSFCFDFGGVMHLRYSSRNCYLVE